MRRGGTQARGEQPSFASFGLTAIVGTKLLHGLVAITGLS